MYTGPVKGQNPKKKKSKLKDWLHMWQWFVIGAVLLWVQWKYAPADLGVTVGKFTYLIPGALVAYWIARTLFSYARPDKVVDLDDPTPWTEGEARAFEAAVLGRALVVAGFLIAMAIAR